MNIGRKFTGALLTGIALFSIVGIACGSSGSSSDNLGSGTSNRVSTTASEMFPDGTLAKNVRLKMKLPEGADIPADSDFSQYTFFNAALELYIENLTGLERLSNLEDVDLAQNKLVDITPLGQLTKMKRLNLSQNAIVDISALAPLTDISYLHLMQNQISDISVLSGMIGITEINIQDNLISDIAVLANMKGLEIIRLNTNQIVDLSPLASLPNVKTLEFSKNQVTDLSPLLDAGWGEGTEIRLWGVPLDENSINNVIPALEAAGVDVKF
jgi:Leucine-rich repeat (LRR) protein